MQPINDALKKFAKAGGRFAMPGHKGRLALFGVPLPCDITELAGVDNLYAPQGCIAKSQALFAQEQGAAGALYSVNGSTAGNLAMFLYLKPGTRAIVARDFHVSVESGLRLSGVAPVYVGLHTPVDDLACVDTQRMLQAIEKERAGAVFVTYPNYYGRCCDLKKIVQAAHERGMLVLVDSAHGAHLAYSGQLPLSAGACGADLWTVSAHKTLPAPNQTAALLYGEAIDGSRLKACLNSVQTTSPSYLLLAGLDAARDFMATVGKQKLEALLTQLEVFDLQLESIEGVVRLKTDDRTKLVLDTRRRCDGFVAQRHLESQGVYVECAGRTALLAITSVCDTEEDFSLLSAALATLPFEKTQEPRRVLTLKSAGLQTPKQASEAQSRTLAGREAIGRICAASVFCYPPGIPILAAGQQIDGASIQTLDTLAQAGYNLIGYDLSLIHISEPTRP